MTKTEEVKQEPSKKVFNILHVVSKLPLGGVENMLMKVVRGYDKSRFNVIICCIKEGGEVADALRSLGFRVEILGKMKKHGFDWSALTALYRFIKKNDIHILRTHQYHANLYGRIAAIFAGVPVIIPSFHSRYMSPNKPKLHRMFLNFLLSLFSHRLVAVSSAVSSDIMRYDRVKAGKIKVIYNGVKIDDFNPDIPKTESRIKLGLPASNYIIGTVGRVKEEKGHKFLIEAVSGLKDVCIAIAGDGPLMKELKELSNRLGVKCVFMGMLPPEKIPVFLNSLDIFCFPSLWEGFPSALVEAMAAGLPVVASDIPSSKEIIGDAGIIVPPGSSRELGVSLRRLIDDEQLRNAIGRRASEKIKTFSIENTVNAYQELFEEVLKTKGML